MPEVRKLWQTEGLFSDHYLRARLKHNEWWPTDAAAQPIWQFCKELYEKRAFALCRFDNEIGARREFIDKILERLGFAWSDNLRRAIQTGRGFAAACLSHRRNPCQRFCRAIGEQNHGR